MEENLGREILVVFLMFFGYFSNYDIAFKIINRLKVNNNNFKFNGNFKSHIIIRKTLEKYQLFPI